MPVTINGNGLVNGLNQIDPPTFVVDETNNRVGIGTSTPQAALDVNSVSVFRSDALFYSGTTGIGRIGIGAYSGNTATLGIGTDNGSTIQNIGLFTNGSERVRITSDGAIGLGTASPSQRLHVASESTRVWIQTASTTAAAALDLNRSRGTIGSPSSLQAFDIIGDIAFWGYNGTSNIPAALIRSSVDGTPSSSTMPGGLYFYTVPQGSNNLVERMVISNSGKFGIGCVPGGRQIQIESNGEVTWFQTTSLTDHVHAQYANNPSYTGRAEYIRVDRAANSAYRFLEANSTNDSDTEFRLRGDGQAYADGSWNGGGADYAEYFEWADGNPDNEDRRGISVALEGELIRPAAEGDEIIGVISGNPSVVGDAAWNKWHEKYLRDEYGSYIFEDYEVLQWTDEEGNERAVDADGPNASDAPEDAEVVIQQRRKLNPNYNPDQEYVNRENRPEWDCVGLMGKLRVRKGQPVDSRWIKMRDISETIEEWLVR